MGLTGEILNALSDYPAHYRRIRKAAYGYPSSRKGENQDSREPSDAYTRVVFSRLKKKGLAEKKKDMWHITELGRKYLRRFRLPAHTKNSIPKKAKNMIVIFDIPERMRKKRNWLRQGLVYLGFSLLQKSVWFGPAPLPHEFLVSLKELELLRFIKFFEAKEEDVV